MKTSERLYETKSAIATEHAWTQCAQATSANGRETWPISEEAVRWCVYGACYGVSNGFLAATSRQDAYSHYLRNAAERLFRLPPSAVNDHLGFDAVHDMIDFAIRLAENDGD
ncbi:MAG TPA: hypothetical protein VNO21_05695 [Polyangiaceae bacterium]|nr:hypothetical protein [Polyangiaceae bacterium]